jgi:hypothetical protein
MPTERSQQWPQQRQALGELWADGWPLAEIARQQGVSRQCLHERLRRMEGRGELPALRQVSLYDLAQALGHTYASVRRLASKLGLVGQQRGPDRTVYPVADLERLRGALFRPCSLCGNSVRNTRGRCYCSEECRKQMAVVYRQRMLASEPATGNLVNGQLPALALAALGKVPVGEEFVSLAEAMRLSGLGRMQLSWLRQRKILAVRPKLSKNRPVLAKRVNNEYSRAQVVALRGILLAKD